MVTAKVYYFASLSSLGWNFFLYAREYYLVFNEAQALYSMGVDSFEKLAEADPRRIEIVSGRKYPFGNQLKESLQTLPPKVEMKAEEMECQGLGKAKVLVTLTRLTQPTVSQRRCYADLVHLWLSNQPRQISLPSWY